MGYFEDDAIVIRQAAHQSEVEHEMLAHFRLVRQQPVHLFQAADCGFIGAGVDQDLGRSRKGVGGMASYLGEFPSHFQCQPQLFFVIGAPDFSE